MHPFFPPELEREIFETAAIADEASIPILLRVCHRVRSWVEPLLYRVLIIYNEKDPYLLALRSKSTGFKRNAVRHVFVDYDEPQMTPGVIDVLSEFSGIESLVIDGYQEGNPPSSLDTLRPRRLSLWVPADASPWAQWALPRPLFSSVTHLELYRGRTDERTSWEYWNTLASLPALTHLCLVQSLAADILPEIMQHCSQLQLAIVAFWNQSFSDEAVSFAHNLPVTDLRVVVMVPESIQDTWLKSIRGEPDFWKRAEAFVAQKRRREIESTSYFLDN
ncbi:hypothetical protein R3P38DRAFT_2844480 [Favolaschia claudopus]|uniref:F-box domain-containing protein n=1 Tax=Favolaschia claudopus TaxID=2862362 RepID=A0AAW0E347_9AGAR